MLATISCPVTDKPQKVSPSRHTAAAIYIHDRSASVYMSDGDPPLSVQKEPRVLGFDQVVCHAAHICTSNRCKQTHPATATSIFQPRQGTGSQVDSSPYSKLLGCMPCVQRRLPSQLSGTGVTGGKDQLAARKSTPVSITNQAYPLLTPDKLCTHGAACRLNTVHWHDLVPELCSRPALYHPCAPHTLTPWPKGWPACALQS